MTDVTTSHFRIVNFPYICSNMPESQAYGVYISQLIRYATAFSSNGDFIDRGGYSLKSLLIKVIHAKNWSSTFEMFMVHTMICYIIIHRTPLSHFCMWPSPLLMCVTYTGFDPTGYDLLYSWFHGGCVATVGEVYPSRTPILTLVFSRVFVLSWVHVYHLFTALSWLWTYDIWLTDDGRLFSSLYIIIY